ncbi:MAG: tRNA dihydrouridine synthase DusB [Clostridia bacterium]
MKLKNLKLENNIFLAPMAGVTDKTYRSIVKEFGCSLMFTEMVSAKAVTYGYKRTHRLVKFPDSQRPIGVQMFGSEPQIMAEAAKIIEEKDNPDVIDINMGCPVPKIVNNNEGSALMKDIELSFNIVKAMVEAVSTPITVKIRKGFNKELINAVVFAKSMEQAGASMVTVHGRTREQYYKGSADWEIIKEVKKNVDIPVVGNGDIFSEKDAKEMFEYTKCDAVMVARGIQGNPFLIRNINHYIEHGKKLPEPTLSEKFNVMKKHLRKAVLDKGEYVAVREMRSHLSWYIKGLPNASEIRNLIFKQTSEKDLIKILDQYHKDLLKDDF